MNSDSRDSFQDATGLPNELPKLFEQNINGLLVYVFTCNDTDLSDKLQTQVMTSVGHYWLYNKIREFVKFSVCNGIAIILPHLYLILVVFIRT